MVCADCTEKTQIRNGARIRFGNCISGGIVGCILNNDFTLSSYSDDNECYVGKTLCYAQETRFGGIVISVNMNHRRNMSKWKILSKIIGKFRVLYWSSVIHANSPISKYNRGEFVS
tara:strand:- start:14968 stop:15315 length:348 start_codon:yes stop_codon:yes gene_type:complete